MAVEKLGLEVAVDGFKKFMKKMGSMDDSITVTGKRWQMLSGAAKAAGGILSGVATAGIVAVGAAAVAAVAGVGALSVAIGKMTMEAIPVEGIGDAFRGMAADVEGGAGAMLHALNEASKGTIANRDLMTSFNQAYQLVGETFAKEDLPEALGYLGKVSAATGEDMSYMMNSLVRGIGRLSPMILDNLGIQVDMVAANEAWAASNGVLVDEMDKTQQQAALMDQVLIQLKTNTADMPDVTDSAATAMAQWQTNMQNFKDTIGLAFLPILKKAMGFLSTLAKKVLPIVSEFLQEKVVPAVDAFVEGLGALANYLGAVLEDGDFLNDWLTHLPEGIRPVVQWIGEMVVWLKEYLPEAIATVKAFLVDTLIPALQQVGDYITGTAIPAFMAIVDWVKENFEPILAALVAIILTIVVPAFIAWAAGAISAAAATIAALAPVILPLLAIGAVVALLAQAWKKNWGGIQDKVRVVAEKLKEYWEEVIYPALLKIWEFVQNNILPIWEKLVLFIEDAVKKALEELRRLWENVVYPALVMVWEFIQDSLIPIFEVIIDIIQILLTKAIEIFLEWWEDKLLPALEKVWKFIKEKVVPILESMWSWIKEKLGAAIEWLTETVLPPLVKAFEALKGILEKVHKWLEMVKEVLGGIGDKLDDSGLMGDSPSPFEESLWGISSALKHLAEVELPKLAASFSVASSAAAPIMSAVSGGSGDSYTTYNNYNLSTSSTTSEGTLAMEFADMAMATR